MKKFLIIIASGLMLSTACKKELTANKIKATVTLANNRSVADGVLVFKLGDTCKFNFEGYANNISFWSGIQGNQYQYRTRSSYAGDPILSFTSTAQFGTQTNTLKVLATTKLTSFDSVTVVNADWTDITSRLSLATSATAVNSGNVSLKNLVSNENEPLYLAFKYTGFSGGNQRTWTITNYSVINKGDDFSYQLASNEIDGAIGNWTRYGNVMVPTTARWNVSATAMTIVGGTNLQPDNTSWLISKPLYLSRVAPDVATASVKNIVASATNSYQFKYTAVGDYKATFVMINATSDEHSEVVKEFNIRIVQ